MGLNFILGNGNCDHKTRVIEEALAWQDEGQNRKVFFLVPNYNKFLQEQELLQGIKEARQQQSFSSIDVQVFSFYRLAWYFLQQTGLLTQDTITESGSSMLLRKTLIELSADLRVFKSEIQNKGFIRQLLDLNNELISGNLTPEELSEVIQPAQLDQKIKERDQQEKLAEISTILTAYQKELAKRNLQVEDPLTILTAFLSGNLQTDFATTPDLTNTLFIAYGFEELYAKEIQLLQVLSEQAELTVALLLDQQYTTAKPSPLDLFYSTGKIFYQLTQVAQKNGQRIKVLPAAKNCDTFPNLTELEKFWRLTQNGGNYEPQFDLSQQVKLWQQVTPEEELRQITSEIRRLLANDRSLRLKDIQLVTNDLATYGQLIPHIFAQAQLPIYIDQKATMDQHPLVEFLRTLFDLTNYNYSLDTILRLLKSELFLPRVYLTEALDNRQVAINNFRRQVDLTENLALKYNFQGYRWLADEDWQVVEFDFEKQISKESSSLEKITNQVRRSFKEVIATFLEKLAAAKVGTEAVELLYQFLVEVGAEETLIAWRDQAVAAGNLELARNHEQTWSALMDLMDEYVQIYGTDAFDYPLFQEIFATGLETTAYGRIPSTIDQIQVNQLTLSRPRQARITFAIGLTESNFPKNNLNQSLLTDEDRQQINQGLAEDKFVKEGSTESSARSPLIAYKLFLSATDKLYLSYGANQDTLQNIPISAYVKRFMTQLKLSLEKRPLLSLEGNPSHYVASYRGLIGQLNQLYQQQEETKGNLSYVWLRLTEALKNSSLKELANRAFASRSYQNIPEALSPQLARKIYGQDVRASVSRLESFYQCEYRFFASYGLRLAEREVYGMDTLTTGSLFHDFLDRFLTTITTLDQDLTSLSNEQQDHLVNELLTELFGKSQYSILSSSARMKYLRNRLGKTLSKMTWAIAEQMRKTKFRPINTEVQFGEIAGHSGIPGLTLPLKNGGNLYVRGKIDRIDAATTDDETWLAVVDYKSGDKQFSLMEAYYGLAMQLITYLDVAITDAKSLVGTNKVRPAGAYYMRIHDPVFQPEEVQKQRLLEKFKLKGFYLKEGALYSIMDDTPAEKEASQIFPINRDAKGILKNAPQTKTFYSETEIDILKQHNRRMMTSAANKIVSGDIQLNPYLTPSGKRACNFCPFRSVCGFDVMLKENEYHPLQNRSQADFFNEMGGLSEDETKK